MSDLTIGQRAATIAVLVENEAGVLARVIGLFSGRGYNIDSLTVAPVDETGRISRITVVTSGTDMVIEQIKAQLDRLVPVHKVSDLTIEGPHLTRELALIKVVGRGDNRMEVLRLADVVWLTEVYAAGEVPIAAADGRALAHALRVAGQQELVFAQDLSQLEDLLRHNTQDGDVVMCMGAGTIGQLPARIVANSTGSSKPQLQVVRP
jgi:acetolactate synthase-1/3 small subunit